VAAAFGNRPIPEAGSGNSRWQAKKTGPQARIRGGERRGSALFPVRFLADPVAVWIGKARANLFEQIENNDLYVAPGTDERHRQAKGIRGCGLTG
jgi:hypothetical protein